jgi:hypothetical protein
MQVKAFWIALYQGATFLDRTQSQARRNQEANMDQHQLSILIGVVAIVVS